MSSALRQGTGFPVQRDADDDIENMDVNELDKDVGKSNESPANGAQGASAATHVTTHEPFMIVTGEKAQLQRGSSPGAEYRETNGMRDLSQSRVSRAHSNTFKKIPNFHRCLYISCRQRHG